MARHKSTSGEHFGFRGLSRNWSRCVFFCGKVLALFRIVPGPMTIRMG